MLKIRYGYIIEKTLKVEYKLLWSFLKNYVCLFFILLAGYAFGWVIMQKVALLHNYLWLRPMQRVELYRHQPFRL